MPLNQNQQRMADLIMRIGAKRGVPRSRLNELAFASFKESGLNPRSRNPSSGAAGLFQLLSSGYVNRANKLGGVHNPRANLLSILPSYLSYWKEHPNAPPGAAARDVERSGMGASWYAPTRDFVSALGGGMPSPQRIVNTPDIDPQGLPSLDRSKFLAAVQEMVAETQQTGTVNAQGVIGAYRDMKSDYASQVAQMGQAGAPATGGVAGPGGTYGGILNAKLPGSSQFRVSDPEGMPGKDGRYHAALDWFAKAGSPVRSPIDGVIVEVKQSQGRSGQVFGGVVKVQDPKSGRVWVFRHVDPKALKVGQKIGRGQPVAGITDWQDGSDHLHLELWKTLQGGYNFSNALDPIKFLRGGRG